MDSNIWLQMSELAALNETRGLVEDPVSYFPPHSVTKHLHEIEIPSPEELEKELPITEKEKQFIQRSRKALEAVLSGQDKRLLLIIGPCSIHDIHATREYAKRFQKLSEETKDKFFLIMRAYFEKPRTTLGWKGILYDPDLDGSYNLAKGLKVTRSLLLELAGMHIPVASEVLEISTSPYYSDLLTWGCIGARTSNSPPHRQLASHLPFPTGFKNTTDGNIENSIRSVLSASSPHVFLGISKKGKMVRIHSRGNQHCHLVLRGGENGPNYERSHVQAAQERCRLAGITEKVIIDCSHDNCEKKHTKQIQAFQDVTCQIENGSSNIVGLMLESNLHAGSQPLSRSLRYGVSITDPCLDWETTEFLVRDAYSRLKNDSYALSHGR